MISEIGINSKDFVRLNILGEILNEDISLVFQLDNKPEEDYKEDIHSDTSRVRVYGRFNVSEDLANNILTLRPVVIGEPLKISVSTNKSFSGKEILIVRSGTKTPEKSFPITKALTALEFVPHGKQKYSLKIYYDDTITMADKPVVREHKTIQSDVQRDADFVRTVENTSRHNQDLQFETFEFDSRFESENQMQFQQKTERTYEEAPDDIQRVEREIETVERKHVELKQKRQSAINHLEKIESEYRKDYDALNEELEEVKSRMEADASIIEYYKDRDLLSVETLLQEAKLKLEDAEKQIRMFIQAKQQKTMEIEGEVKANKK